jgi:chemotaxis protein methyltransferase CheR
MTRRARQQSQAPLETPCTDAVLRERTGLTAQHLQRPERTRRVRAAMQHAGFSDDAAFATFLRASHGSLLDLASALAVGETYFFREPAQLELLTETLLPRLLLARPVDHVLKIWSAGCASGEEPYTIAMLLDERGLLEHARIVGTDISQASLEQAQLGSYSNWSLRGAPEAAVRRYLRPVGRHYELSPTLRGRVHFERHNLTDLAPPSEALQTEFDFIFCKNVLIYLTAEACGQVSRRLAGSLAAGGTLFTGASDPFLELPELWRREASAAGVTYTRLPVQEAPRPQPRGPIVSRTPGPTPASAPRAVAAAAPAALEPEQAPSHGESIRDVAKREGPGHAVELCRELLVREPFAAELHLLHASLLIELDRDAEAADALRSLLYLDAKLALGHFLSALVLRRQGERHKAARAYRRVVALCACCGDEPVPWGEGVSHRALSEAAAHEARFLDRPAGAP